MANTYDTSGEPLGSKAPKVLYNNASNLDDAMNAQVPSWQDRPPFNRARKTWWGIEQDFNDFLTSSGYENPPLVYVDGVPLQVDRPTQLVSRGGILYSVKLPASFPVMLTGTWATDQNLLVVRGDQSLRQDLASTSDSALGAGIIGWKSTRAGAVGRPLSQKLEGDIDVTDFGADPTGAMDSWQAFEDARIAAASFASVSVDPYVVPRIWVPAGTYTLSKSIWFQEAHRIDGAGARIVAAVGFTGATIPVAGDDPEVNPAMFIFLKGEKNTIGEPVRWRAGVGPGITLDCQDRTSLGIYIERMPYSDINCEIQFSSQDAIQVGPWMWGMNFDNIVLENFSRYGIYGLENCAMNGISINNPRIWGQFKEPTAGIFLDTNAQCYGMSVVGGFIEKLLYGVLVAQGNGPMLIAGVDFEQCRNGCVRAAGALSGGQHIGTITISNCLLHSIEGPKVYAEGARIHVTGTRLGVPATTTVDFDTGPNGVITCDNNEYTGGVPGIDAAGANVTVHSIDPDQEIDDSYISHKVGSPLTEYARRLHQYGDAPFLQSAGLSFLSSYAGGPSGQYIGQSDWFVTEYLHVTTPGVPSKVIGVRLSTFAGSSAFKPTTSGTVMCGEAGSSWAGGSTVVAFTVTSDRRTKQDETELSEAEHRVALSLKALIRKFKRIQDGAAGKWHVGVVAQDVCAAFTDQGLNWRDYEIVKHTEWTKTDEVLDDRGNVVVDAREAGDLFGVNYEELLAFVISAM